MNVTDDLVAVQRRITEALRPLSDPVDLGGGLAPPAAYVRRHLVEHAADGHALDSSVLRDAFLPYVDAERLRTVTPQAAGDAETAEKVRQWRYSTHNWTFSSPAANAAALAFTRVALGQGGGELDKNSLLRVVRAHWPVDSEVLTVHAHGVQGLATATVNGRPVAVTANWDRKLRLWDLVTGRSGKPMAGHRGHVTAVCVADIEATPYAVSGDTAGELRVWDLARGGEQVDYVLPGPGRDRGARIKALAVVPGHSVVIVVVRSDGRVAVWRLQESTRLTELRVPAAVSAVGTATVDGRPLTVFGDVEGAVRVYDVERNEQLAEWPDGYPGGVRQVAVGSVAGRMIVLSSGQGRDIWMRDLHTGDVLRRLRVQAAPAALRIVPLSDRDCLLAGGADGTIGVLDLESGEHVRDLAGHTSPVTNIVPANIRERSVMVSAGKGRTIRLWDLAGERGPQPAGGLVSPVRQLAIIADLGVAVTAGTDGMARRWELSRGEPVGEPVKIGRLRGPSLAAVAVDGRPMAVVRRFDGKVHAMDLETGEMRDLWGDRVRIEALTTLHIEGTTTVVAFTVDHRIGFWDPDGNDRFEAGYADVGVLDGMSSVSVVRTLTTGVTTVLVAGSRNGMLATFDIERRRWLRAWRPHRGDVAAMALVDLDGRPVVLTSSADPGQALVMSDAITGEPVARQFPSDGRKIRALAAVSGRSRALVLTGDTAGTLQAWDLTSREPVGVPVTAPGAIYGIECFGDVVTMVGAGVAFVRVGG
ncbi:WD40 repeat domain-containing protein [Amycolatopsis tolypomycina]|uniref:WD40 repeat domain-containing protein n=1 Tax=Amycolatopsis tolypomycina TaxID=208445 RepID=UPI0033B718A1